MALLVPYDGFTYHPHQREAVEWMLGRESESAVHFRGGILADEMGLGKTWMAIGLLLNAPLAETLLLVPPVLQPQWTEALARCSIRHRILRGSKKNGTGLWTEVGGTSDIHVTLCTYDRAIYNEAILRETTYDRIVCDEGHVLRNGAATRRYRVTASLPAGCRWILSGTPVQNRCTDFDNLLEWLGMTKENRLKHSRRDLANSLILRRTVGEVRDAVPEMPSVLPTHVVHPVRMPEGSEEETVFNALVGRFEHAIEVHAKASIILELYLRIQQYIAHPAIYVEALVRKYGANYKRTSWSGTASKMGAFRTWLSSEPAEPTIVFTTFRSHMELAATHLTEAGYQVYRIAGGMTESSRTAALEESRVAAATGRPTAVLVQIVAGSAGLNLQHCSRVVFLTSHWNPAVVDQAVARAYRIGQKKHVTVHHFLLADGAEKNIDRLMVGTHGVKREVARSIHDKLYCESAANVGLVMEELNDVLPAVVEALEDDDDPVNA